MPEDIPWRGYGGGPSRLIVVVVNDYQTSKATAGAATAKTGRPVRQLSAVSELNAILVGPLPTLPRGGMVRVAGELRRMETPEAQAVWRHEGWAEVVGWIVRRVPDCDPVVPAIHALRRAPAAIGDPEDPSVARRVLAIARRSPADRRGTDLPLDDEPAEVAEPADRPSESLFNEVADLLGSAGLRPSPKAREAISAAVDVAADWWDGFARHTGLLGADLVAAARDAAGMSSEWRLRRYQDGAAGRPLVALLLGGDQWGLAARRACGQEASLLLWALLVRHARQTGAPEPVPPAAVVRAWTSILQLVETALAPAAGSASAPGPTAAA